MKLLQNPGVVSVLVALAILVGLKNMVLPLVKKGKAAYERVAQPAAGPLKGASNATGKTRSEIDRSALERNFAQWVQGAPRDPFSSVVKKVVPTSEAPPASEILKVGAIWVQGQTRRAVVNGQIVKPGDVIEGYVIYEIQPGTVVVEGPRGLERLTIQWTVPEGTQSGHRQTRTRK